MSAVKVETKECLYCSGKGYFQLLLGGSETCPSCGGTGKEKESK
ncbi:YuiA family protein [Robertmurraya korlensis]